MAKTTNRLGTGDVNIEIPDRGGIVKGGEVVGRDMAGPYSQMKRAEVPAAHSKVLKGYTPPRKVRPFVDVLKDVKKTVRALTEKVPAVTAASALRSEHDPKTCRVYRCGACVASKGGK